MDGLPAAHVEDTPDTPTIETLVADANARLRRADGRAWTAADTLKNVLLVLVHPDGGREPVAIGVPGDREVDPKRLEAALAPAEVTAFTEADFAAHPDPRQGVHRAGRAGPEQPSGIRYLLDPRVVDGTAWVTGADRPGRHVFDLVAGRDFTARRHRRGRRGARRRPLPALRRRAAMARGIEIGHIFQLGRKYAEALGLKVLDENGQLVTSPWARYGIGVSRAVAAIAESTHDELGLCWPREVAPADVHVVATGKDEEVHRAARDWPRELEAAGVRVLLRRPAAGVSPGVKFKDAELIGVPTILVVGKGLADGVVELRDRRTGEREDVPVAEAVKRVVAVVPWLSRAGRPRRRGGHLRLGRHAHALAHGRRRRAVARVREPLRRRPGGGERAGRADARRRARGLAAGPRTTAAARGSRSCWSPPAIAAGDPRHGDAQSAVRGVLGAAHADRPGRRGDPARAAASAGSGSGC